MAGEWQKLSLGDIAEFASGNRNSQDAVAEGPFPFFTCSREVLRHTEFDFDTEAVIMAGNNADARFHLQYFHGKFAARQRTYIIRPRDERLDCRFLYYAMHQLQPLFAAQAQGTTTKFVTIGILRNAPLMLPPLHEQLAIADILGTLDDKIELNRRMNETLEEIARTLFTSWFVTFDPVRAKAEGRQPEGMDAATAALFPDAFVDSELGEIPAGWRVSTVSFVVSKLNRGLSPSYVDEGGVLVINQKCIRDHRVDFAKTRRHNDNDRKVDGRLIEVGDIVVNSTGVGTLGRVAPVLRLREPTIVDSHVTIVRANPKQVPWQFLWFYFLHREPEIEQLGEGSTGQTELSRARLGDLSIVLPPASLLKRFVDTVEPLLELIAANQDMSETLAEIRDTLLPKLLSGEVRVPLDQPAEVALP